MAGTVRLAAVPEESTDGSALYRDSIRMVAVSGAQIRSSILFSSSQSGHSGSSYSSASNSCPSNNSGCSFVSGFFSAYELAEIGHFGSGFFSAHELTEIAHRMVSDGYTQRMVQAFDAASPAPAPGAGCPDDVLETWFCELDVGWVLQIGQQELPLQGNKLDSSLQGLVERWIRGLTLMVHSIIELVSIRHEMTAVARFGEVSISKMLGFIDAIISHLKPEAEKLQAVLDMYVCFFRQDMYVRVFNASYMFTPVVTSPEAQSIFDEICGWLESGGNRLREAISSTMEEVIILMEEDESWAIEIPRGGGEIHKNTRLMMDCIMCMKKSMALVPNSEPWENLGNLINTTIGYLKDLLLRKSEMCLDPSLRYLFLLNNSYFVVQVLSKPSVSLNPDLWSRHHLTLKLAPECKKHMDSYLDVSWGRVLSYMPKSRFPGPIQRWIKTSPLSKFKLAFQKTYQAQKFWKVPDPWLRDALRRAITERVVSGYCDYLGEHPELEKHVCFGRETNSSEVLKEMLGELFEG